jgi:hypothetical protein
MQLFLRCILENLARKWRFDGSNQRIIRVIWYDVYHKRAYKLCINWCLLSCPLLTWQRCENFGCFRKCNVFIVSNKFVETIKIIV